MSTWGSLNSSGQQGDGTINPRLSATAISVLGYVWNTATPILSPIGGSFSVNQNVSITSDTVDPSLIIRYTTDGTDPDDTDAVYSPPVLVDRSLILKARAWVGSNVSGIATGTFVLQAVQPTVSPSATTYTTPQMVTFSTTTGGASIRYTTDGTNPTETSTLYDGPFQVAHTTTFKIAAFKSGWSTSTVRTSPYTMNFGTLSAPVIDPPSGTYTGSVTMTTSTTAPGVVRYTFNSSGGAAGTPAASSTDESPKVFKQSTNVRARSFHPNYTTSVGEVTRAYTIVTHTPILSAASGSYAPGSIVTITAGEPTLDTLRMTIDGTDPTSTSTVAASGTSLLLGNFTLKVRAFRQYAGDSVVASATYTLDAPLGAGAASGGGSHSIIATPDGRVYAFGENGNGQLGIESVTDKATPTLLNTITGVTSVASAVAHTLARTWDGQVYAWGLNTSGRLGDGTTTQRTKPTHLTSLTNIAAIAAGDAHGLAQTADGRVFAWGENGDGQLGLGSTVDTYTPTEVPGLTGVVAIAAGNTHSVAITASGALYVWGNNANSRLGDGLTADRNTPFLLGLTDVVAIAAADGHNLAILGSGAVYSWGLGTSGQLGRGTTASATMPTLIPGLWASAIAAAGNNSAVVRSDGVLVTWGDNASGQIGDTTSPTDRLQPTAVVGPVSVSTIALGAVHAIAVTPGGDVWTWGEFASGRLGDGSIADRPTPAAVMSGISNWAPAAPTVSTPSQTFSSAQTVTLASSTAGAVVRYNLNGTEPNETDAEAPVAGVEVAFSSLLRAKAFATGRLPGQTARASYELQSVAPTIYPSTGTYTSAQTVTLSVSGPPSVIRYTLDGSAPTATSTEYSGPLIVSTFTTIKARAFPTNGWTASSTSSATLTLNYGTLSAPNASVAGGVFPDPQSIALSAPAGASIRYTVNGTEPTAVSNLYVSPISVSTGTVELRARAFHPDWTESSTLTQSYTIDTVAPSITSSRFPAAIGGWHNAPTTVSFGCADNVGIASCTLPVAIATEGEGQALVGTAVDQAGREATVNLTVHTDFTLPALTLTSPATQSTTTDVSVAITGEASDQLSGLSSVTCNGVAATVVDGDINCTALLQPGINDVVLVARDAAGNTTSAGVRVIRTGTSTTLGLAPTMQTVLIADALTLKLSDDFGSQISGATWESSDSEIVSVSTDDPPILTALTAGTATITATKNGLSAQATLVVVAGPFASGTKRWALDGLFGGIWYSLPANRVDPSVPAMFSIESSASGTIVRGVTTAGDVEWVAQSPGHPIMADSFGALIAGEATAPLNGPYGDPFESRWQSLMRFAGPATALPWRYDSVGRVEQPAQAPDGTIYALEKYDTGETSAAGAVIETQIVVLDGQTGQVRSKIPLARERRLYTCSTAYRVPETLGPIVGNDGYGYVLVRNWNKVLSGGCGLEATITQDVGLRLLRISPTGGASPTVIYSQHCEHGFYDLSICNEPPNLVDLLPDGIGGTLVRAGYTTAAYLDPITGDYPKQGRLTRIASGSIEYDIASEYSEMWMTTDAGLAFVTDNTGGIQSGLRAISVLDGTTAWSVASSSLRPVTAMPDGRVALIDSATEQVTEYSATGEPGQSGAFDWYWGYLGYQSAFGMWTGIEWDSGQLSSHISLPLEEVAGTFAQRNSVGSEVGSQQRAPSRGPSLNSMPDAALAAFDFFQSHTRSTPWEWGGLICPDNGRFTYSRIVTNNSNGFVQTIAAPGMSAQEIAQLPSCGRDGPIQPVGAFHFHVMDTSGQPYPSGYGPSGTLIPNDLNTARLRPELGFFAQTPVQGDSTYSRTARYWYQAQQIGVDSQGQPIWSAYNNTLKRENRQWVLFDPPPQ